MSSLSLFPQATACTSCAPSSGRPPAVPGRRPTPHCQAGMAGLLALPLQTLLLCLSVPTGSSAQSHVCRASKATWAAQEAVRRAGARREGLPSPWRLQLQVPSLWPPLDTPAVSPPPLAKLLAAPAACAGAGPRPWGLCVAACPPKAGSSVCFQNPHLEELSCRHRHSFPKFPAWPQPRGHGAAWPGPRGRVGVPGLCWGVRAPGRAREQP